MMATVFWDARGIIHIDYLPSKQTINSDYYVTALLDRFNNILKKKWPHLAKKKVLLYQDNARVYTAPMAKFNEFRYEMFPHPAYSPDLIPCDYFLFPNLKKWFGGKRFTTREQLITETETYFGLDKLYYSDDLKKLENHWIKCIERWLLRNKNESIKKNVFYCVFLKTYWLALVPFFWHNTIKEIFYGSDEYN